MKTTKFIIAADDPGCIEEDMTDEQWSRTHKPDMVHLMVIECVHPNWQDNLVTIGQDVSEVIRDKNGTLYFFHDLWDKKTIIDNME